jgi:hypothetical protein
MLRIADIRNPRKTRKRMIMRLRIPASDVAKEMK